MYLKDAFNIIPFKTVYEYISGMLTSTVPLSIVITNLAGNLVAFAPFALFLPLIFRKMKSFVPFLITMLCIVVFVESLQFALMTGSCDIDDLILNVGGACILYWILHIGFVKKIIIGMSKIPY